MKIITQHRFELHITGSLPNTRGILISDFCNVLENNLNMDIDFINEFRHLHGGYRYDYHKLLNRLNEDQKKMIYFYFTY